MAPVSAVLVLGSALLHAAWNSGLKKAKDLTAVSLAALSVAVAAATLVSVVSKAPAFPKQGALGWTLLSGLLEGGYVVCLVQVLARAPLGWAYSWMRGSAVVLVWPLSLLLLGETIHPLPALGVVLVLVGLVATGQRPGAGAREGVLVWALGAGACNACYNLCYKASLTLGANPASVFALSLMIGVVVQVLLLSRQGRRPSLSDMGAQPLLALIAGLGCAASFLAYLFALRTEGAAAVTTLRNTSVVFAQVLALGLGERPSRNQWSGAFLILGGAVLLGWPR
ncbi:MAG TPA: DMT family transporter [Holophagaceae bacterium]|nr:DMT family transporter [Holophagaceae bacterium]